MRTPSSTSIRRGGLPMRISTSLAALAALVLVPSAGAPPVKVVVPAGFKVSTFATGLEHPTAMAWGPDRRLYVTEDTGLVVVARPGRKPLVVARGLRTPLGLTWRGRELYVSEQGRLGRYTLQGSKLTARTILVRGLPFGLHQQDSVVVGPDNRLYLGSGSTCDACREQNPRSATILSMKPDGSDVRVVARGLRNPFGLAFQPGTSKLYASVNGQDKLGTKAKPEPAESVVARPPGSVLRLAALLAELREEGARRSLPRSDASGRLSRAALVCGRPRLLAGRSLRGALGPVPERPARPEAR